MTWTLPVGTALRAPADAVVVDDAPTACEAPGLTLQIGEARVRLSPARTDLPAGSAVRAGDPLGIAAYEPCSGRVGLRATVSEPAGGSGGFPRTFRQLWRRGPDPLWIGSVRWDAGGAGFVELHGDARAHGAWIRNNAGEFYRIPLHLRADPGFVVRIHEAGPQTPARTSWGREVEAFRPDGDCVHLIPKTRRPKITADADFVALNGATCTHDGWWWKTLDPHPKGVTPGSGDTPPTPTAPPP